MRMRLRDLDQRRQPHLVWQAAQGVQGFHLHRVAVVLKRNLFEREHDVAVAEASEPLHGFVAHFLPRMLLGDVDQRGQRGVCG